MHLTRSEVPKIWPLPRKGSVYLVRPRNKGLPLLIAMRDLLQVADTRKDVKNILKLGKIKVNGKVIREEKYALNLFDNLSLDNKNYKILIKNKKFVLTEEKNSDEKIVKIIGKKMLKKGKLQVNLSDGRNYISKEKLKTGDSVVLDLKGNKISEILEFKEGCKIIFISGKHIGEHGKVMKIDGENITIKEEKEEINCKVSVLMVVK